VHINNIKEVGVLGLETLLELGQRCCLLGLESIQRGSLLGLESIQLLLALSIGVLQGLLLPQLGELLAETSLLCVIILIDHLISQATNGSGRGSCGARREGNPVSSCRKRDLARNPGRGGSRKLGLGGGSTRNGCALELLEVDDGIKELVEHRGGLGQSSGRLDLDDVNALEHLVVVFVENQVALVIDDLRREVLAGGGAISVLDGKAHAEAGSCQVLQQDPVGLLACGLLVDHDLTLDVANRLGDVVQPDFVDRRCLQNAGDDHLVTVGSRHCSVQSVLCAVLENLTSQLGSGIGRRVRGAGVHGAGRHFNKVLRKQIVEKYLSYYCFHLSIFFNFFRFFLKTKSKAKHFCRLLFGDYFCTFSTQNMNRFWLPSNSSFLLTLFPLISVSCR